MNIGCDFMGIEPKKKHKRKETGKRLKDRRRARLERLRVLHLKTKGVIE